MATMIEEEIREHPREDIDPDQIVVTQAQIEDIRVEGNMIEE